MFELYHNIRGSCNTRIWKEPERQTPERQTTSYGMERELPPVIYCFLEKGPDKKLRCRDTSKEVQEQMRGELSRNCVC